MDWLDKNSSNFSMGGEDRSRYFEELKKRTDVMSAEQSAPTTPSTDYKSGAMAAGSAMAQGGSGLDATSAALMASGNPYAMAGGLALQTISAVNKSKQQREQNRYLAEVQRVKARQDAIDRMATIGQNLRA